MTLQYNNMIEEYYKSYHGIKLLKEHNINDYGIWEILGEDPECDLAWPHSNPTICFFEGSLKDTIEYAIQQPNFYTWGCGGKIKLCNIKTKRNC